jgi:hypothetical protein
LSGRWRIKTFCGTTPYPRDVDHRKWLTLGGRERIHLQNNIKVKPEKLKLSKTYPSTWPQTAYSYHARLWGELDLYAKPALRVGPYFHVLASSVWTN